MRKPYLPERCNSIALVCGADGKDCSVANLPSFDSLAIHFSWQLYRIINLKIIKMELTKELIEKAKNYLSNEGYGTGTNFTTNTVANLMAEFAVKINSNESNEFRTIGNNENTQKFCPHCGKYKRMQGNGIMHQLCECGDD